MRPQLPQDLQAQANAWDHLGRWERSELGRAIRKLGWSYGEIMDVIPVPKGTLANWCQGIDLTESQIEGIVSRTNSRRNLPRDTQRKRRHQVEDIKEAARLFARSHLQDPFWVAGTVLYWGEGSKTAGYLEMANADPRALILFMEWSRRFHRADPTFVLHLHLHEGNNDESAREYWRRALNLSDVEFYKTFIKHAGTGHRKNHLPFGVCRVRMRRGTDALIRTLEWIDVLSEEHAGRW